MKFGLLADSHDHLEHLERALAIFRERGVEWILHAGDIVSPPMVLAMQGFRLTAVYGNNDGEKVGLLKAAEKIGGQLNSDFAELDAPSGNGRIALYHGTYAPFWVSMTLSGNYRVVVTGHTHKPVNRMEGNTLVLNPGTSHGFRQRATAMVYDDAACAAELIEL
ncbi:MAG: metallophosphoesterase [Magnetococcales bacterium]|nr:metallophosphoesterase [Magnetococcales bacterium]